MDDKEVIASDIQRYFISDRWKSTLTSTYQTHILKYILKHDVSHRERESEYGFRPSFLYCALIL